MAAFFPRLSTVALESPSVLPTLDFFVSCTSSAASDKSRVDSKACCGKTLLVDRVYDVEEALVAAPPYSHINYNYSGVLGEEFRLLGASCTVRRTLAAPIAAARYELDIYHPHRSVEA